MGESEGERGRGKGRQRVRGTQRGRGREREGKERERERERKKENLFKKSIFIPDLLVRRLVPLNVVHRDLHRRGQSFFKFV